MMLRSSKLCLVAGAHVQLLLGVCACSWLYHGHGCLAAEPAAPTVEQIIGLWTKRQRLLKTAFWECQGKVVLPRGWCDPDPFVYGTPDRRYPQENYEYEFPLKLWIDYERGRLRTEYVHALCQNLQTDGTADPRLVQKINLFDGNYTFRADPEYWTSADPLRVHINKGMHFVTEPSHGFAFLAAGIIKSSSKAPFRSREDASTFSIVGSAAHQGRQCVLLRTDARSASAIHDDIWVDVERDAAIVKMVTYANGRPTQTVSVEYGPVGRTWLPTEYSFAWSSGSLAGRIKVIRVDVNARIDPDVFRLVVDEGTIIQNNISNQVYVAAERGDVLRVRTRAYGAPSRGLSFTTWAAVLIACLVVLRVSWWALRRKRVSGATQ